jgi:signal transduction histidine kinase
VASAPLSAIQIQHQRRTALLGAALVAPFALADLTQGGSGRSVGFLLAARAAWIVALLLGARLLSARVPRAGLSAFVMSGATAAAVLVIVAGSGGTRSGYFAFLLALPFCMLVLLPGHLFAAITSGGVGIAAGALMLADAGAPLLEVVRWTGTGFGSSILAAYATHMSGLLIQRELDGARARSETVAALAASERRRAASERLATVGRLAAGVAHEINNPLSFVKANLVLIHEHLAERGLAGAGAELETSLTEAALGVERIRRIVADLRGFAREGVDEPCGTAVEGSVDEALRLASLRMRRIAVRASVPGGLPSVRMCRKRLVQVLVNLFVNAADAVEEAPHPDETRRWVDVSGALEGDEVVLRVADGGPGIAPDALNHLFEPFFTTKPLGTGVGLGLALSHEYVTAVGGRLTGANAPDGGAVFEVRLPTNTGAPGCDACYATALTPAPMARGA